MVANIAVLVSQPNVADVFECLYTRLRKSLHCSLPFLQAFLFQITTLVDKARAGMGACNDVVIHLDTGW